MPIQQRLFVVFSSALLFMILLLSGYTILTVQRYLENDAVQRIKQLSQHLLERMKTDTAAAASLAREASFLIHYELMLAGDAPFPGYTRHFPADSIPEPGWSATAGGSATFSFSDRKWLFVVSPWVSEENRLVIRQARDDIGASLRPIRHIIYTGMLFSLVLIAFVSGFTSRSLARPITQIAEIAEAIASGDRSRSLSLNRNDEFGRMAASLSRMAVQLQQESEIQKELNARLRHFHSDLAHEIRNPVHAINLSLEMLAEPGLSDESRQRYQKQLDLQVSQLNRLVNDLLILQKFEENAEILSLKPVSLETIVQQVLDLHRPDAEKKGISLETGELNISVLAHPLRLEQIIGNLVSNALKFTDAGFVKIYTVEKGSFVEIHVEDSGRGIEPDQLNRIFDRFVRLDSSRNRETGGAGLGLAVVKSLIHAHGSEIFVNSIPGKGTGFYFRLKNAATAEAQPI